MKFAIIENGKVVNSIIAESQSVADRYGVAIQHDIACPGWDYSNGVLSPPPNIPTVAVSRESINMARLFLELSDIEQEMVVTAGTPRAQRFMIAANAGLDVPLSRVYTDMVEVFGQVRADELVESSGI